MSLEYNFDGLVGPTHNYAGLSVGNMASMKHKAQDSCPKQGALQGLGKMKLLMEKGYPQAVLPPQARPHLDFLKYFNFSGTPEQILKAAHDFSPILLRACYSASSMWTANAATVSPSADTKDHKVHFTPANLCTNLHRSIEARQTYKVLSAIFADQKHFKVHKPLPAVPAFADEGAANHSRFCSAYDQKGVELFAYGFSSFEGGTPTEHKKFKPRQSQESVEMLSLQHGLDPQNAVFAKQTPEAIDAGVFHNDVISTADKNLFLYHEKAFVDTKAVIKNIEDKLNPTPLLKIEVKEKDVPLSNAVSSYLFNSQLLPISKDKWLLLAPTECETDSTVKSYLESLKGEYIEEVEFIALDQSMRNGGGPACLRLRVALTDEEAKAMHQGVVFTPALYDKLVAWVNQHYRDTLNENDLLDPKLMNESYAALDELTSILKLGSIYSFQK